MSINSKISRETRIAWLVSKMAKRLLVNQSTLHNMNKYIKLISLLKREQLEQEVEGFLINGKIVRMR